MGLIEFPSPHSYGSQATIEYWNHSLCGGTAPDGAFSADWVALARAGAYGFNIFQIGYDKCKNGPVIPDDVQCGPTSPNNVLYYFWAYGNEAGFCGQAIPPVPVFISYPPSGTHVFKVTRGAAPTYDYQVFIDGALKAWVYQSDVENCWDGVGSRHTEIMSEVWDAGTQSGGSKSNKQGYTDARYRTELWFYPLTRPLNAECDFTDRVSQHCNTSSVNTDDYYMYDSRFP